MKITLIGNAGLYLQDKTCSFLIDGLFSSNIFFNHRPAETTIAAQGWGRHFRNADFLLFTHRHEDHFSSQYVNSYISNNFVQRVYVPTAGEKKLKYVDKGLITAQNGETRIITVGKKDEILLFDKFCDKGMVVFFKTLHIGGAAFDVPHYSIAVLLNGNSYIFMGDAAWEYSVRNVRNIVKGTNIQGIFINPLSYADRHRRGWLEELNNPPVFLYHFPFADDDVSGMRELIKSFRSSNVCCLSEKGQAVYLD